MTDLVKPPLSSLLHQAQKAMEESIGLLDGLLQNTACFDELDDGDRITTAQLVLQYRLNCEDTLALLLQMNQSLLSYLGIQPQQSAKMNLDRLTYAVGSEDIKQILNILAILVGSLAKLSARQSMMASHSFNQRTRQKSKKHHPQPVIQKAFDKQQKSHQQLVELNVQLIERIKHQSTGPVFDDIAALEGPFSKFYQAIMNGLGKAKPLYQAINKHSIIERSLNELVHKTEHTLNLMPTPHQQPTNFKLHQFDHSLSSAELERRAANKRMRPFFGKE